MTRITLSSLIAFIPLCGSAALGAADIGHEDQGVPRVVGQVLFGTAGFEPGIAAEWTFVHDHRWRVRPELFLSEDSRPGAGVSLACETGFLHLPAGQELFMGPRVLYHNSDDYGFEADLQAIYSIDLIPAQAGRHHLEVIGAAGVVEDKRNSPHRARFGGSVGVGYGYQF